MTELALIAPLFALLLLLFAGWARLAVTRLALIQASRDATLMLARNPQLWSAGPAAQEAAVRRLVGRGSVLDPSALKLSYETVSPGGLDRIPALGPILNSPLGSTVVGWAGLRRYRFRYHVATRGLMARFTGGALTFEEALVVHGDPWMLPASELMSKAMQGGR